MNEKLTHMYYLRMSLAANFIWFLWGDMIVSGEGDVIWLIPTTDKYNGQIMKK